MTEYIVQIEDSEENMSERFVGQLRSYPELIRCKDCKYFNIDYCTGFGDGGYVPENGYCHNAESKTDA